MDCELIGGPLDGQTLAITYPTDVIDVGAHDGRYFHADGTRFEWHEPDWEWPAVRSIREAFEDASKRVFG